MSGDPDGSGLVRDSPHTRLPNPPGRIGGKLVTAPVFKLVHCFHQAEVSLLDQIYEFQPAIDKFLTNRDDQAKVRCHEFMLRGFGYLQAGKDLSVCSPEFDTRDTRSLLHLA